MKRFMTAILLFTVLVTPASGEVPAGPVEVVNAFHDALEAGDAEAALKHLSPDVVIYESGGVEASRDEYASHHLHSDMKFLQTTNTSVIGRTSGSDGDHAWVLTRTETSGSYNDQPIDLNGTETMILERMADGWKIVHIHWSSHPKHSGH